MTANKIEKNIRLNTTVIINGLLGPKERPDKQIKMIEMKVKEHSIQV